MISTMTTTTLEVIRVREMCRSGEARRIREATGLSLEDCSPDLPVCATTLSRWERGVRMPRRAHAIAYGVFLDRLSALTGVAS